MAELHELCGSSAPGCAPDFEPIAPVETVPGYTRPDEPRPAPAFNPELADLVRQVHAASQRVTWSYKERDRIIEANKRPAPPEVLFRQAGDSAFFGSLIGDRCSPHGAAGNSNAGRWFFGSNGTIETLRREGERIVDGGVEADDAGRPLRDRKPNEAGRARLAEILSGYDRWMSEIETWEGRIGLTAISAEWSAALDDLYALWPKLAEAPARTLADFALKASALVDSAEEIEDRECDSCRDLSGADLLASFIATGLARFFYEGHLAGTAHVPPAELDAPLVAAWGRHQPLLEDFERLSETAERIEREHVARQSALVPVFRPRDDDFASDPSVRRRLETRPNGFYADATIKMLRSADLALPEHGARAAEIVAAHDAYGEVEPPELVEANALVQAVAAELGMLGDCIRNTAALSLRGIGIKASWALQHTLRGEQDVSEILRQVEAFAHRHAAPAKHADVPRLEREAMGGLPAADCGLYHLFVQWLESANESEARDAEMYAVFDREGDQTEAYQAAEKAAKEAWVLNEALRSGIIDMPAASMEGLRLKGHVYQWLCRNRQEGSGGPLGEEENVAIAREKARASDHVFAFAIARDLARLAPARSLDTSAGRQDVDLKLNTTDRAA